MINEHFANNIFKVKHVNDFHSVELVEIKTISGQDCISGLCSRPEKHYAPRQSM